MWNCRRRVFPGLVGTPLRATVLLRGRVGCRRHLLLSGRRTPRTLAVLCRCAAGENAGPACRMKTGLLERDSPLRRREGPLTADLTLRPGDFGLGKVPARLAP